jgi:hypothetical protein
MTDFFHAGILAGKENFFHPLLAGTPARDEKFIV